MNVTILTLVLIFSGAFGWVYAQPIDSGDPGNYGTLNVEIQGLRNQKGLIRATLFNNSKGFPNNPELASRTASVPIREGSAVLVFEKIPYGVYAVGVFHDENLNKKMDAYFWGAPKEGYGSSNDARGLFGPPSFEDAKFIMHGEKLNITITMVYND